MYLGNIEQNLTGFTNTTGRGDGDTGQQPGERRMRNICVSPYRQSDASSGWCICVGLKITICNVQCALGLKDLEM